MHETFKTLLHSGTSVFENLFPDRSKPWESMYLENLIEEFIIIRLTITS